MRAMLLLSLTAIPAVAAEAPKVGVVGYWQGTLSVGALDLRLGFDLTRKWGVLRGTMDSIDQEVRGLPIASVDFTDRTLTMKIPRIGANYSGKMADDGKTIAGEFEQTGKHAMTLTRTDGPLKLNRPQHPTKPYPYVEEAVKFDGGAKDVTIAGTFTKPKGEGPFTAVILISGSGPQDRDESILGHKPFLVLADHLTRNGFAVLRYDDRGVGQSTGNFGKSTSADFAADARGAMAFLKARADVKRIGLIGHSEGGMIAPMVAAEDNEVAFIVLLAGPGTSGRDIIIAQARLLAKAGGADAKALDRLTKLQTRLLDAVMKESDAAKTKAAVEKVLMDLKSELPEDERKELAKGEAAIKAQTPILTTPWYRFFLAFDPKPTLAKVKCPVLAVNGSKDLQVPCKENLEGIAKALADGGNKDVTTREFADLNHLFQKATTGLPAEYGMLEETFSPAVLEAVTEWIKKR